MVDHDIHRIAAFGQEVDCSAQQSLGTCAANAWQDDKAGVNVLRGNQSAKIPRVFRDENKVPFKASGQNLAVRRAQAAEVPRMYGDMYAFGIESLADPRRQALVKKQAHARAAAGSQAAFRQGLPEGRPRSGWALA